MSQTGENTLELAKIITSVKGGDEQAFRRLFDYLHGRVFGYCMSRAQSREEALDLTQDIFIDLWQAMPRFRYKSDGEFYSFVFLIARRKLAKHWRKKRPVVEWDERYVQTNYTLDFETYGPLLRWVQQLKPKYQEVIKLRYWSQLSFGEISAILKIKEGTAKVWHLRAVKRLQILSDKYEQD